MGKIRLHWFAFHGGGGVGYIAILYRRMGHDAWQWMEWNGVTPQVPTDSTQGNGFILKPSIVMRAGM